MSTAASVIRQSDTEWFTRLWKEFWSKSCPSCGIAVVKNGGCPHMECQSCGKHWCWLCEVAFTATRSHESKICGSRAFRRFSVLTLVCLLVSLKLVKIDSAVEASVLRLIDITADVYIAVSLLAFVAACSALIYYNTRGFELAFKCHTLRSVGVVCLLLVLVTGFWYSLCTESEDSFVTHARDICYVMVGITACVGLSAVVAYHKLIGIVIATLNQITLD